MKKIDDSDFSNGWRLQCFVPVAYLVLILALIDAVFDLLLLFWVGSQVGFPYIEMCLLLFAVICIACSECRNTYIISNGRLYIKEYRLFEKCMDMSVSLSVISGAEVVWSWSRMCHLVRITVNGEKIDLACIVQSKRLAETLNAMQENDV